jgi:hypothetical protein
LRGKLAENAPLKVSGKSQGNVPTDVEIGELPVQELPATCPAVSPLLSLASWLGKLLTNLADMLLGKFFSMYWANSGVMALAEKLEPTADRSTSTDPKKNNLFLITGPPIVPFASLR